MKIIDCHRKHIYQILGKAFEVLGISPVVIEVGVCKGDNAERLNEILRPSALFLMDSWSAQNTHSYELVNDHRDWVDKPEKYNYYYNGSVHDQSTFDNLFKSVQERFSQSTNVRIYRERSLDGARKLQSEGQLFDLIYLDASHHYEDVYDDLKFFSALLKNDVSLFQLNDCCHSRAGIRQNLGVLEACVRFCKEEGFLPLLLTNNDWTDVVLCKRGSRMEGLIDQIILENGITFVELPHQLLGALSIRGETRKCISFT